MQNTKHIDLKIGLAALLVCIAVALSFANAGYANAEMNTSGKVLMQVFWGDTCPNCITQKPFLDTLQKRYKQLEIRNYEVYSDRANREIFARALQEHGVRSSGVPAVFITGKVFFGDAPGIRKEIEWEVQKAIAESKIHPHAVVRPDAATKTSSPAEAPGRRGDDIERTTSPLDLPFFGAVDPGAHPLLVSTVLIAFVDGFNPCSLWVLMLLLGMVLHSGSRKRVALVGSVFLTTTALVYGLFIASAFTVLTLLAFLDWVRWVVALFALVFGLVNIKDYFWFKKGFSFSISDEHKPVIYKSIRGLMNPQTSGLALVSATVVMAAGIAVVELPCTAGFPIVWSELLKAQNVGWLHFLGLITVYLLVYLSIEIAIFLTAVFTLKMGRFEEKYGQLLKLFGGAIMLALAMVLIFIPGMMNDLGGMLSVFGASALFCVVAIVIRKIIATKK